MSAIGGLTPNPQTTGTTPDDNSIPARYSSLPVQFSPGDAPLGAYTDSTYLADEAALRYQISTKYNDLLQQLGYTDASGRQIPGRISADLATKLAQDEADRQRAVEEVTRNAQNTGTIFSGIRGTLQAQAEDPFVRDEGATQLSALRNTTDAFGLAQGLANEYNMQRNQLLAAAAARAAAAATMNPTPPPGGPTSPPPANDPTKIPGGTIGHMGWGGAGGYMNTGPPLTPVVPPAGGNSTAPPIQLGQMPGDIVDPNYVPPGSGGVPPAGFPTQVPVATAIPTAGAPVAYEVGGEVTQPTHALLGEVSSPGDKMSHEVVVPRYRLTPKQNKALDKILDAAGIISAAHGRLATA